MRPSGYFDVGYGTEMAIMQTKTQWLLLVLLIVFVCLIPLYPFIDLSWLTFINFTLITIIIVLGLNITTGLAGQVSMGHAAFVMVGAYSSGVLTVKSGLPFSSLKRRQSLSRIYGASLTSPSNLVLGIVIDGCPTPAIAS